MEKENEIFPETTRSRAEGVHFTTNVSPCLIGYWLTRSVSRSFVICTLRTEYPNWSVAFNITLGSAGAF